MDLVKDCHLIDIKHNKWLIIKSIGSGSFGKIYSGKITEFLILSISKKKVLKYEDMNNNKI